MTRGTGIASGGDLKIKAGFAEEVKEMEIKEMSVERNN